MRTLEDFGVEGKRIPECTGVWVSAQRDWSHPRGDAKIAAIGIKVSKWVTMHGLAFNVAPDMRMFEGIIPCGLSGRPVTSLADVLGRPIGVDEVIEPVLRHVEEVFGLACERTTWDAVLERAA